MQVSPRRAGIDANKPWLWMSLVLLGLVIRVWGLSAHSLDFDESWSLHLTHSPLDKVLGLAIGQGPDLHPPIYYLMLRVWVSLFGSSEIALRSLSVAGGVVLVGLNLVWSSDLSSRRTAVLAALLAATSPYLVWQSQEARMYIWIAAFGLASVLALARALRSSRGVWWLIYFLLSLATLYTHLVGGVILLVHLLLLGLMDEALDRRRRAIGVLAVGLLGLAYLPYALSIWDKGAGMVAALGYPRRDFFLLLRDFLSTVAVYVAPLSKPVGGLLLTLGAGLAIAGLGSITNFRKGQHPATRLKLGWMNHDRPKGRGGWKAFYLALFLVSPILVIVLISAALPFYHPKYIILATPPLLLLWGEGIQVAWKYFRPLGLLVMIFLVGLNFYGLVYNLRDRTLREDWRTAGEYLSEHSRQEDAVLVHLEHYYLPLQYYYRGPAPVTHPFGSQIPSLESVEEILREYERYDTVWLTLSAEHLGDPERIVEGWFRSRYPLVTEIFPSRIRIQGYAIKYRMSHLPPYAQVLRAKVGDNLHLRGYTIDEREFPATSQTLHPPSNWVHVTLFWEAKATPPPLQFRLEMVDSLGQTWGGNLLQTSGLQDIYPIHFWSPDEILRDDYEINLNPITPPGEYLIILRATELQGGIPLPLEQEGNPVETIVITTVKVTR